MAKYFILYLLTLALAVILVLVVLPPIMGFKNPLLYTLATEGAKLATWVLPTMLFIKLVERKDVFGYLKLKGNISKGIGWGLALGLIWVLANLAGDFIG